MVENNFLYQDINTLYFNNDSDSNLFEASEREQYDLPKMPTELENYGLGQEELGSYQNLSPTTENVDFFSATPDMPRRINGSTGKLELFTF